MKRSIPILLTLGMGLLLLLVLVANNNQQPVSSDAEERYMSPVRDSASPTKDASIPFRNEGADWNISVRGRDISIQSPPSWAHNWCVMFSNTNDAELFAGPICSLIDQHINLYVPEGSRGHFVVGVHNDEATQSDIRTLPSDGEVLRTKKGLHYRFDGPHDGYGTLVKGSLCCFTIPVRVS